MPADGSLPRIVQRVEGEPVRGRIRSRTLVQGDRLLVLELMFDAGAATPSHVHGHESACYVVSGRVRNTLRDETQELGPGGVCHHPEGVPHSLEALEDSILLEVKSPAPDPDALFGPGA